MGPPVGWSLIFVFQFKMQKQLSDYILSTVMTFSNKDIYRDEKRIKGIKLLFSSFWSCRQVEGVEGGGAGSEVGGAKGSL